MLIFCYRFILDLSSSMYMYMIIHKWVCFKSGGSRFQNFSVLTLMLLFESVLSGQAMTGSSSLVTLYDMSGEQKLDPIRNLKRPSIPPKKREAKHSVPVRVDCFSKLGLGKITSQKPGCQSNIILSSFRRRIILGCIYTVCCNTELINQKH